MTAPDLPNESEVLFLRELARIWIEFSREPMEARDNDDEDSDATKFEAWIAAVLKLSECELDPRQCAWTLVKLKREGHFDTTGERFH